MDIITSILALDTWTDRRDDTQPDREIEIGNILVKIKTENLPVIHKILCVQLCAHRCHRFIHYRKVFNFFAFLYNMHMQIRKLKITFPF